MQNRINFRLKSLVKNLIEKWKAIRVDLKFIAQKIIRLVDLGEDVTDTFFEFYARNSPLIHSYSHSLHMNETADPTVITYSTSIRGYSSTITSVRHPGIASAELNLFDFNSVQRILHDPNVRTRLWSPDSWDLHIIGARLLCEYQYAHVKTAAQMIATVAVLLYEIIPNLW